MAANALFQSMLNDIYTITNRPDLVTDTTLALKAATLKAHHSDFYPKDLYENGLAFDTSSNYQSLDYRQLISNWRALKYLRKYDAVGLTAGDFLDFITPEQVLDGYGVTRKDVCYLAGAEININMSTAEQYFLFGCYVSPIVIPETYSSWIALDVPTAITFEAARVVFSMIGFAEQAATYRDLVAEQYTELKTNLLGIGY